MAAAQLGDAGCKDLPTPLAETMDGEDRDIAETVDGEDRSIAETRDPGLLRRHAVRHYSHRS
jgi:hypothetical protein